MEIYEIESKERRNKLNKLETAVNNNPFVNNRKVVEVMEKFNIERKLYVLYWDKTELIARIMDNVENNTDGFQDFFIWYIDEEQTVMVYQIILWTL